MRRGAVLALLALAGCQTADPVAGTDAQVVTVAGNAYTVRLVADEPQPASDILALPDGRKAVGPRATFEGTGPAIRVGGAINTLPATEAVRQFCKGRGVELDLPGPVRFDDATTDHVFYMSC